LTLTFLVSAQDIVNDFGEIEEETLLHHKDSGMDNRDESFRIVSVSSKSINRVLCL
jgi:hypothetical protein